MAPHLFAHYRDTGFALGIKRVYAPDHDKSAPGDEDAEHTRGTYRKQQDQTDPAAGTQTKQD